MPTQRTIHFYRVTDPFGEFSNFAPWPILLKGKQWPTSEHYFQAQKFAGTRHEEELRMATSPSQAARMGRDRRRPLRHEWESVKDDIMREVVLAKFEQYPSLMSLLLSTDDAEIIEHTESDAYWGDGGDGSGKNMLGRILMETREKLAGQLVGGPGAEMLLRRVRYVRYEFHGEPERVEKSLLAFLYDLPYLAACGIFPPLHLLNEVLTSGGSEGGMSPGATWEPFRLTKAEYGLLCEAIRSVPLKFIQSQARYASTRFKFDRAFDGIRTLREWAEAVCAKHRSK